MAVIHHGFRIPGREHQIARGALSGLGAFTGRVGPILLVGKSQSMPELMDRYRPDPCLV